MNPEKKGRSEGPTLILGITDDETVVAYFIPPDFPLAIEISHAEVIKHENVFIELSLSDRVVKDTKQELLEKLLQMHSKGWIPSKSILCWNRATLLKLKLWRLYTGSRIGNNPRWICRTRLSWLGNQTVRRSIFR
ncbi:hypothetical protein [Methylophaga sp. UBA2689]|uniref:hypothetical protein n=1 Tax=Methylophaga sp. UBA2689 TaxID=1946878 RepID=UPI0025EBEB34|nr:hypothetical protein [Methylophaga sp. UBA2689]